MRNLLTAGVVALVLCGSVLAGDHITINSTTAAPYNLGCGWFISFSGSHDYTGGPKTYECSLDTPSGFGTIYNWGGGTGPANGGTWGTQVLNWNPNANPCGFTYPLTLTLTVKIWSSAYMGVPAALLETKYFTVTINSP